MHPRRLSLKYNLYLRSDAERPIVPDPVQPSPANASLKPGQLGTFLGLGLGGQGEEKDQQVTSQPAHHQQDGGQDDPLPTSPGSADDSKLESYQQTQTEEADIDHHPTMAVERPLHPDAPGPQRAADRRLSLPGGSVQDLQQVRDPAQPGEGEG